MARSSFQKLKLLYLYKFLLECTDENHTATVRDMIDYLSQNDISAERKSIYNDIELLELFGADIVKVKSRQTRYYIASREFELPELKLLVDLVQSSKFLNKDRSLKLINKLKNLCSKYEAQSLGAHINLQSRVKNTSNYNIYYNVDAIHNAILDNKKIEFLYFKYNILKEKEYRRNGEMHIVSPIELMWDDENYYLLCIDDKHTGICSYRVDRMEKINITDDSRDTITEDDQNKLAKYETSVFSMFSGEFTTVRLTFKEALAGVAIDRFGKDIIMVNNHDGSFSLNCEVAVSSQFFGWLAGLGTGVKIDSPKSVQNKYKDYLNDCLNIY